MSLAIEVPNPVHTKSKVFIWKEQLAEKLDKFSDAFSSYYTSIDMLSNFLNKTPGTIDAVESLEEIINSWVDEQCVDATSNSSSIGHLEITSDKIDSNITEFYFPHSIRRQFIDNNSVDELICYALLTLDFDEFEGALIKKTSEIESDSFKDAANILGAMFNLTFRHCNDNNVLQVKQQKGRFIAEISNNSSWAHDRIRRFESVIGAISTFQRETGMCGLHDCILSILEEERGISGCCDCYVPGRTKVHTGESVEAIFFKGKIKFYFKPNQFEALIGFVKSYTDYSFKAIEVK